MKDYFCMAIGAIGGVIAGLFGGWDAALQTLVIFMAVDYITGLIVAGVFHASPKTKTGTLESRAGGSSVTVADTGIGIAPEHQARVFERFYRVDKSHSKASGGTGLGLSIVKHAMQLHHGRIELESTPGTGTTIRTIFPKA